MKKFLIKISYTVLPVWLLFVGGVLYVSLYLSPRISGDLGALACIPFGHEYDERMAAQTLKDTLFRTISTEEELYAVRTDVLTIGDSFSQQQLNSYQNYLAACGHTVANCSWAFYNSPLQYAYNALDEGRIDSSRVNILIIEVAERLFEIEVNNFSPGRPTVPRPSGGGSGNEWSLSRARDVLLHRLGLNASVNEAQLNRPLFDSDEPQTLYFYYDDIGNGTSLPPSLQEKVKAVQAALREKAARQGIRLIWLIPCDKYSLYQDDIADNPFPRKTVIDDVGRMLGESDDLLLTKGLLRPMVERGEKDVYLFNDSHWSYKATQVIARELHRRITSTRSNAL